MASRSWSLRLWLNNQSGDVRKGVMKKLFSTFQALDASALKLWFRGRVIASPMSKNAIKQVHVGAGTITEQGSQLMVRIQPVMSGDGALSPFAAPAWLARPLKQEDLLFYVV